MQNEINVRITEHFDKVRKNVAPNTILGTFNQGSQNYGFENAASDIDTRSIILPTFKDIALNTKMLSTTYLMENDEHCDVKDVRHFFQLIKKGSPQYLELLYTPYKIINSKYEGFWQELVNIREDIVGYHPYRFICALGGMGMEKYKALEHPYPATAAIIEKYGYDPKQLHHLARMYYILDSWLHGYSYEECLRFDFDPTIRNEILKVKHEILPLEEVRPLAASYITKINELMDKGKKLYPVEHKDFETEKELDTILLKILKVALKEEFNGKAVYYW